jgi:hypothetical protein
MTMTTTVITKIFAMSKTRLTIVRAGRGRRKRKKTTDYYYYYYDDDDSYARVHIDGFHCGKADTTPPRLRRRPCSTY